MEITPAELARRLGTDDAPFLLDVREPAEVSEWPMPGALNIPLGELREHVAELPDDREVVVICASGRRSERAADLLDLAGVDARSLVGGITAWGRFYDEADVAAGAATVVQLRRRGKGCLSYIVGSGGEAAVVDPSLATDLYAGAAARRGWRIVHVLDTHLHADHLSGARALAEATGATLHLNPADTFDFPFTPLRDGETVSAGGAQLAVTATSTPGHTNGSTTFVVNGAVALTGDTLFVDGVGRPDLAEKAAEFARNLYHSLHERVLSLPDDARVMPAHYGENVTVKGDEPVAATVGELRGRLPELQLGEDEFVAWASRRTTDRPPNYVRIITANMGRADAPLDELLLLESGPNRCSA